MLFQDVLLLPSILISRFSKYELLGLWRMFLCLLNWSSWCKFFCRKFILEFSSMHHCFTSLFVSKPRVISTKVFFPRKCKFRDGYRATATSKMERFVIIDNGWKPLTIITKHSILDVAAALDPPLKFA